MTQALEGIKILDFTTAIAGSFAIRLLADLGADVIKIESFEGDSFRSQMGNFINWNMGKRSLVVNLKEEKGRNIIYKLVKRSDVVAENFRPGTTKKLGIDYEILSAINPKLIYSSQTAWGDSGPYGGKPGYDPVLQAESGVMASQGEGQDTPMDLSHAEVDVATTELHAFSILAALYVREKTGKGQVVKTSLLIGALSLLPDIFLFYNKKPEPTTAGEGYLGPRATEHFYKTRDKWIFLECTDEECWDRLCVALEKPELKTDPRFISASVRGQNSNTLSSIIQDSFKTKSAAEWLDIFEKAYVPCSAVNQSNDIPALDHIVEQDLLGSFYQPIMESELKQTKTLFRLSETPSKISRPAPLLGEHTHEILHELAYSEQEIEDLRKSRIIP